MERLSAKDRNLLSYAVGLGLVGVLLALKLFAFPELAARSPFLLFLVVSMLSAYLGGLGPGIVTTAVSALVVDYFFIPPTHQLLVGRYTWQTLLFAGEGAVVSFLAASLRKATTRQTRAVHVRDSLMGVLAHDLRNPISVIAGSAGLLKETLPQGDGAERAEAESLLEAIERSAQTMAGLVNDLLDTSRIEAGAFTVARATTDLLSVINEVKSILGPLCANKRIRLIVDAARGPFEAEVDAARIRQALLNLVGNAIKFTPSGGEIRILIAGVEESVRITVADTGTGIAATELAHIFDRFWQGATKNRHAGAGLGLFIVKSVVDAHGGVIKVDSQPGAGTSFAVTLPRRPPREPGTFWRRWRSPATIEEGTR